ncbi:hypothetical protein BDP27DRAFT_1422938 [Rhodocollybia butyracea]|uniref:Uncharacterized protein n=1 Tax=Rhodocollybia butyracea TaxID=206335 RepID=A0A9P5U529_9AGAR|nr:hypothetical protein BDP27DRAFT_1422938 [Rhodocollybia butyracea]
MPDTLQSLDMSSAMQTIANAKKPSLLPAFRPGHQLLSQHPKSPSPSPPGSGVGKVEADELKALSRLTDTLKHYHTEIFDDKFDYLLSDLKCKKLDNATAFVKDGLASIAQLEVKWKARLKMAAQSREVDPNTSTSGKEKRDTLVKSLKAFHMQPTSTSQNYSTIWIKLGMSTVGSGSSNISHSLSQSQNEIISDMPTSLLAGVKKGLRVSCMAFSKSGAIVEAGIHLSVNDLPAARKIAGFQGISSGFACTMICGLQGKTGVFNTKHSHWVPRDKDELCSWSTAYRDAQTLAERKSIFEKYGI